MRKVLIISNPDDEHTSKVLECLDSYNCKTVLFFPEELGTSVSITMCFANGLKYPSFLLQIDGELHDLNDFQSIWYRRPRGIRLSQYEMNDEELEFARDEWGTLLRNAYALQSTALWVSHPTVLDLAANKILQLKIADELGFKIPHTIISNDAEKVAEFIVEVGQKVITKATGRGWVYRRNGEATYVLTNRLTEIELANLHEIRVAPPTFQNEIQKDYEVRVNIVGQRCLAIKIDSQKSELSQVDWRRYDVTRTPYTPIDLPLDIEQKCLLLCKKLGLEFGAIDLICRPNGDFVFLEVNGNGQFLWAEYLSDVNISDQLARLLAGIEPALKDM